MERVGRYALERQLGAGGSGTVHAARLLGPSGLEKRVALKLVPRSGEDELIREARIGGLLRHRNLVDVYEVGIADETWFCAMELCAGCLADHLPLSSRAAVEAAIAVCDALEYAHDELELVHLDLKPQNLLFADDGTLKVADLGISRAAGFTGYRKAGTPGFMAPEQQRGDEVGPPADVYALGRTLLALVEPGQAAASDTFDFDVDAPQDTSDAVGEHPLADVLESCLSPVPSERPTVLELRALLEGLDVSGPGLRDVLPLIEHSAEPISLRPEPPPIGREAEIHALSLALAEPGVVILRGSPGIGKTLIARVVASRWSDDAVWCDLDGAEAFSELLGRIGGALEVPLTWRDSAAQIGHALAARGRLLLILDHAKSSGIRELLAQWREQAPSVSVLVTARGSLGLEGERTVVVGPLRMEAAMALLRARALERGVDLAAPEHDHELAELAERLDRLPLGLELAAGRLGVLTPSDVLKRLSPSFLRTGRDERVGRLEAVLREAWGGLDTGHQRMLSCLAVFSGSFRVEAAQGVIGITLDQLRLLVRASWFRLEQGRVRLSEPVRQFLWNRLEDPAELVRRHARWYVETARVLPPEGSGRRHRALYSDRMNHEMALRRALASDDIEPVPALLQLVWETLGVTGPFSRMKELLREAAPALDSTRGRQLLHRYDAEVAWLQGQLAVAEEELARCLALAEELEDADLRIRGHLLAVKMLTRRPDAERYQRHVEASEALGSRLRPVDRALMDLARARYRLTEGRLDDAEALACSVVPIFRGLQNQRAEADAHIILGSLTASRGQCAEAFAHYDTGIALQRASGDLRRAAEFEADRGNVAWRAGDLQSARECYERALRVHRRIGNRVPDGIVSANLAMLLIGQDDIEAAIPLLERAERIAEEAKLVRLKIHVACQLADIRRRGGELEAAAAAYEGAVEAVRGTGDDKLLCQVLADLGATQLVLGRTAAARLPLDEAARIAAERGYGPESLQLGCYRAVVAAEEGAVAEALADLHELATEFEASESPASRGLFLGASALVEALAGRVREARDALSRAEEMAAQMPDVEHFVRRAAEILD